MTSRNRRALTGLAAAAVVASLAGGALLRFSPVPLTGGEVPDGGVVSFDWSPPLAQTASASDTSPAGRYDRLLADIAADRQWTSLRRLTPATGDVYGGPFGGSCTDLLTGQSPLASTMRRGIDAGVSVTLTAQVHPAGTSAAAVAALRDRLAACDPDRSPYPALTAATVPGDGFAAVASNGGDGVAWLVWARGDLVLSVATAAASLSPRTATASAWADRLDRVATRALSGHGCLSLTVSTADAARNPYTTADYSGWARLTTLALPAGSRPAAPVVDLSAPGDAPEPDVDPFTDGDLEELPDPSAPTPDVDGTAVPRPDLAVPVVPAAWPADVDLPAFEDLPLGPAPMLVDPATILAPEVSVAVEPAEPAVPGAPDLSTGLELSYADVRGPGCGWAFHGTPEPAVDAEELAAGRRDATVDAFTALTLAAADAAAADATWVAGHAQWQRDHAQWRDWAAYQARVSAAGTAEQDALDRLAEARTAYDELVARWTDAQQPTDPAPVPEEDPMPVPSPAPSPSASPLPSPSGSPSPEPTEDAEPGLLPVPALGGAR